MVSMTLRLPDTLHEALQLDAKESGRSLHGHIIWLLTGRPPSLVTGDTSLIPSSAPLMAAGGIVVTPDSTTLTPPHDTKVVSLKAKKVGPDTKVVSQDNKFPCKAVCPEWMVAQGKHRLNCVEYQE